MILVFDVGNTNIVLGAYKEDKLMDFWRMATDTQKTADEYGIIIMRMFINQN